MKKCIVFLFLCFSVSVWGQEYDMESVHPGVVYLKSDIRIYGRVDGNQYLLYQCKNCETTTGHPFYLNPEQLPDSIWFDIHFPRNGTADVRLMVTKYKLSFSVKNYLYTYAYIGNYFNEELMKKLRRIIENGSRIYINELIVTTPHGKLMGLGAYINSLAITPVEDYSEIKFE